MNFNTTWCMAVGGMIGGGIFSVLGIVIQEAGRWTWLSFIIAGLIAVFTAYSYSALSTKFKKGGGAFTFLKVTKHQELGANVAWVLVMGYILTVSVYAFTFGHYVASVFNQGSWLPRLLSVLIIVLLTVINLKGITKSALTEIITVYGKLIILLVLAIFGILQGDARNLSPDTGDAKTIVDAFIGAAIIFMAYEGFQLLSYDYEDLEEPDKTLPHATISAVIFVMLVYVVIFYGSTMLVGREIIIEEKEIALAIAGKKAFGQIGLYFLTLAAAFSTASAINATLYSTAKLMKDIAKDNELPELFSQENFNQVPANSILAISIMSSILAVIGSLGSLVEVASIIFLIVFSVVNFIAFKEKVKYRWVCFLGFIASLVATLIAGYYQAHDHLVELLTLLALILFIKILRSKLKLGS